MVAEFHSPVFFLGYRSLLKAINKPQLALSLTYLLPPTNRSPKGPKHLLPQHNPRSLQITNMRVLILLASAASLFATLATAMSYGNFSRSCTGVDLFHNFFLGATCCHPADNGADVESQNELDLTMCIGLNQVSGKMQWEV
jgi:hypothetical protein